MTLLQGQENAEHTEIGGTRGNLLKISACLIISAYSAFSTTFLLHGLIEGKHNEVRDDCQELCGLGNTPDELAKFQVADYERQQAYSEPVSVELKSDLSGIRLMLSLDRKSFEKDFEKRRKGQ